MNTSELLIENSDLELAQNICKTIENDTVRSRAIANVFAVNLASKFFDDKFEIDSDSGLHNITAILEKADISDIYINGNYIDVRIVFENDTLSVPKAHFENDLLPLAYAFIKIDSDFSSAEMLGFIRPEEINQSNAYNDQILIDENNLVSFYDIEPYININDEYIDIDDESLYKFLNKSILDTNLCKDLIASKDSRLRLAKIAKAQYIFNFVSVSDDFKASENTINEEIEPFSLNQDSDFELDNINDISDLEIDTDVSNLQSFDLNTEDNIDVELEEFDNDNLLNISENEELEIFDNNNSDISKENEDINEINLNIPEEISLESSDDNDSFKDSLKQDDMLESNENLMEITDDTSDFKELEIIEPTMESTENLEIKDNETSNFQIEDNEISDNIENIEATNITSNINENAYKTVTTPSMNNEIHEELYEDLMNDMEQSDSLNKNDQSEEMPSEEEQEKNEQINSLFNDEIIDNDQDNDSFAASNAIPEKIQQKKNSKILPLLGLITILGALGYYGYMKFTAPQDIANDNNLNNVVKNDIAQKNKIDAMPIETVETTEDNEMQLNETTSSTAATIEQNLDASILVSNLKVDWEVPAGYVTNTSAKRYLIKMGKVLQLNLKTELLLLSKPPITNKIGVEIKYNENSRRFEPVGITISSGEKSVDDLILNTVKNTLAINLSVNTDSISKLQGNPILIIHL